MRTLAQIYAELRRPYFVESYPGKLYQTAAKSALHQARMRLEDDPTDSAWEAAGGEVLAEYDARDDWEPGDPRVRIVERPDDCMSWDDLAGDCYTPELHPDINPNIIKRQAQEYRDRIESDGVWYYESQVWTGAGWEHVDSIGGFVGDDFRESGYDGDLKRAALDKLEELQAAEAAAIEATRPDLYGAAH